jgi:hypothetical protein
MATSWGVCLDSGRDFTAEGIARGDERLDGGRSVYRYRVPRPRDASEGIATSITVEVAA